MSYVYLYSDIYIQLKIWIHELRTQWTRSIFGSAYKAGTGHARTIVPSQNLSDELYSGLYSYLYNDKLQYCDIPLNVRWIETSNMNIYPEKPQITL